MGRFSSSAVPTKVKTNKRIGITEEMINNTEIVRQLKEYVYDLRATNHSPKTITALQSRIRGYVAWALHTRAGTDVTDITKESVRDWLMEAQDRGLADASIRNYFAMMRMFCNWAAASKLVPYAATITMKGPKVQEKPKPVLRKDEVLAVLDWLSDNERGRHFKFAARNRAIVLLLFDTGLRADELCGMRWEHIDWDEQEIMLPITKDYKGGTVHFNDTPFKALRLYRSSVGGGASGPVWVGQKGPLTAPGVYQAITKLFRDAGVEKRVGTHTFRHSFATHLAASGIDKADLKELGRWASWAMVERYSKGASSSRARAVHKKFDIFATRPRAS